eukprot:CAMPEP_0113504204 /NCGR_PEP_ID=MMETSP0014_2-20120614/34590_1 /TAXON_ID=2857 /ORGANISM="Nitzschia sp." /LENGTH=494 /DNA_ID=CAMNT_0000399297 /DNA_START=179 /DNA_END=1659 /DNA_ORIENTATION=+ /assembly_acc=CAM_ASM_000159
MDAEMSNSGSGVDDGCNDRVPTGGASARASVSDGPPAADTADGQIREDDMDADADNNNNNNNGGDGDGNDPGDITGGRRNDGDANANGQEKDDDDDDDEEEEQSHEEEEDEEDNGGTGYDDDCDDNEEDDHENQHSNAVRIWMTPSLPSVQSELRSMSVDERQRVWDDLMGPACSGRNIHRDDRRKKIGQPVDVNDIEKSIWGIDERKGANSISVETPDMVSKALEELDKHLRGVLSFGDTAIRHAYKQNPDYINDSKFRLAFLRSDRFDAKKASLRMVRHFDTKRKLFGSHVLGRDIRQSDLSDDDLDFLNTGSIMISPYKDRHGRTVGVKTLKTMKFKTRQNFYRVRWYIFMTGIRDEDMQENGCVQVQNFLDPPSDPDTTSKLDYQFMREMVQVIDAMPMYFVSMYIVTKNTFTAKLAEIVVKTSPSPLALRTRIIIGSEQECMYDLMCLGVPLPAVTKGSDGVTDMEAFREWVQHHRELEDGSKRRRLSR